MTERVDIHTQNGDNMEKINNIHLGLESLLESYGAEV